MAKPAKSLPLLQFVFDTDHLTLFQHQHPKVLQRLAAAPPDSVAISAITVEEVFRGRLAAISRARDGQMRVLQYGHLLESLQLVSAFPKLEFDQASENEYQHLRSLRLRVGSQDLKIAAVARAHNLTVLSRNRRDFGQIPGIMLEDWSVSRYRFVTAKTPSVNARIHRLARQLSANVSGS